MREGHVIKLPERQGPQKALGPASAVHPVLQLGAHLVTFRVSETEGVLGSGSEAGLRQVQHAKYKL